MDSMKKIYLALTGGNVGQDAPQSGGAPQGGGAISKAIGALQKSTGKLATIIIGNAPLRR